MFARSKGVRVDVGPEQGSPAEPAVDDLDVPASAPANGSEHRHAMDFADLQSSGRFVRDSRVGGMLHVGKVSLREDSPKGSLHVSVGEDNRVSVHIDRFSPLAARKPGRRRAYSAGRVIVHNVGIVVDYVILRFQRRFGEQRCELECEKICVDVHDDENEPTGPCLPRPVEDAPLGTVASSMREQVGQSEDQHLPRPATSDGAD